MPEPNRRSNKAVYWLLISVFLFLLAGILIAGFLFYASQRDHIRSAAENDLSAVADLKVDQINRWLNKFLSDANILCNNPALIRQIDDFLKSTSRPELKQDLQKLMTALQDQSDYKSVLLLDRKGNIRLSSTGQYGILEPDTKLLFESKMRSGLIGMTDLRKSELVPFAHIDIIASLQLKGKNRAAPIGALLLRIDPEQVLFPLIQSWPTPSKTAETLLIEQEGDSIIYLNELRHQKNTTLNLRMPIAYEQLPASMAVRGASGIMEGIDYRGVPVLAAVRKIPSSSWYMVSKMDLEEIYAPLRLQAFIVGIVVFLVISITAGIVVLLWRRQNALFSRERHMDELEREAIMKNFDFAIKYANDIILLVGIDGRIIEANDQACKSYGYTRQELSNFKFHDLDSKQNPDEVDMQLKKVIDQDGLVFETEHLRKDGTYFPVEVSSRFIEVGEIGFYQNIIRDITDRKRSEEALRASEAMLLASQRVASLGHYELDINSGTWTSSRVLDEMFGIDHNFPKNVDGWLKIVHPDDREELSAYLKDYVIKFKNPFNREYRIIRIDNGAIRWLRGLGELKLDDDDRPIKMFGTIQDITEYKQVEEVLLESEVTSQSLLNATKDAAYLLDTNGRILALNESGASRINKSADELLGKCIYDLIPPELAEKRRALNADIIRSRKPIHFEDIRDGNFLANSLYPIFDLNGKVIRIAVFSRDETEQKKAEEALIRSESRFRRLTENAIDLIFRYEYSPKRGFTYVSPAATRMTGYTPEEHYVDPDLVANMVHPDDKWKIEIENLLKHPTTEPLIVRWIRKDGAVIWTEQRNVLLFDGSGNLAAIEGIARDITDRKRAEEAIQEFNETLNTIFEAAPLPIYMLDREGRVQNVWNPAAEKLLGWKKEEVMGKLLPSVPPEKIDEFQKFHAKLVGGQPLIGVPAVRRRKDGSVIEYSIYAAPLHDNKRNISGSISMLVDLSENKKLQQELTQSQKLLSIGTMAGGIAHDFNNILAIILGYSSLLDSIKDNPKSFSDGVTAIRQAVDRGAGLVRQILTFARKTDVLFQPLNVPDLLKELISMLQQTFPRIITFKLDIERHLPYINADHTQVHQALLNLCVNARDAMPDGGQISIKAQTLSGEKLKARFPSAENQRYLELSVSDTGLGIEDPVKNQIFDPFFTTKGKEKGTGLGLSVVYGIIQAHHGFIDLESEIGRGTVFHLYFPIPQDDASVLESQKKTEGEICGGNETLLFVEDEILLLEMVQILLESNGYKVLTAKDGKEAIEVYSKHKDEIALVISDLGLPKIAGLPEFEKLKEINPEVRVIFASGYFEPDIKSALERAGALGFLQKPYVTEDILIKIRDVIDTK